MRHALPILLCLVPASALARPITAGVDLGVTRSDADDNYGNDASRTLGLFGRLGLTSRLAGQLELQQVKHAEDSYGGNAEVRSATALLVVELASHPTLVPTLLVGIGLDRAEAYGIETSAHHIEGGFGLEYRAAAGFTIGANVRMGGRSLDGDEYTIQTGVRNDTIAILPAASALHAGEYRSARLTLGVRF